MKPGTRKQEIRNNERLQRVGGSTYCREREETIQINQSNLLVFGIAFAMLTIANIREIIEKRRRQRVSKYLKILYPYL